MSVAFLFPGQGSQTVGMGRELAEASAAAAAVWRQADEALGFSVSRLCFEGPEGELTLTANTQPAVLTASVAAAAALAERGVWPALAAGHSLGEYSALVTAGALGFPEAVRLVRRRGEYMQEAVPVGQGAMAALLGVDLAVAEEVCAEAAEGEVVGVANVNAPGQIVIAGHRSAVERAVTAAATRGGRKSVMLPVSAPFHCALMKPAADRLAAKLATIPVEAPRVAVARNIDGDLLTRAEEVKPSLVAQVASPVRWTDCVTRLDRAGATIFVEVGPGRVLSGLLRRTLDGRRAFPVEDRASLEAAVAAVAAGDGA
jgi:[acyl-carrier-protein] S-malonyltransferase